MGLLDSMNAGADLYGNFQKNQMLHDQLQTYPALLQAQLQQNQGLASTIGTQAQYAPSLAQQDLLKQQLYNKYYGPSQQAQIGLTNAQTGQAGANAGYIGTEEAKNQFLLNNPGLMIPGIAGQMAGINTLQNIDPSIFRGAPQQMPQNSNPDISNAMQSPNIPNMINSMQSVNPNMGLASTNMPMGNSQGMMPQQIGNGMAPQNAPSSPVNIGANGMMNPNGMFGGNPVANRLLQGVLAPINKDIAQTQYYNARTGQLMPQIDPTTGNVVSTNTTPNQTLDQRTIGAIQRVNPLLQSLSNNLSQFQTATGEGKLRAAQVGNYLFGMNNPSANQYAQGQADLKTAPESLLKAWGLNVTNESLERMEDAVKPIFGESQDGYQNRIINTLQTLQENQNQAAQRLKGGTTLGNTNNTNTVTQNNANSMKMVQIKGSDGRIWNIPADKLNAALTRDKGAQRVS